jgi:hypothetical protein
MYSSFGRLTNPGTGGSETEGTERRGAEISIWVSRYTVREPDVTGEKWDAVCVPE